MKTFSEYVQQILIDHLLCQALRSALNQTDSGLPPGSPPVTVPLRAPCADLPLSPDTAEIPLGVCVCPGPSVAPGSQSGAE